MNESRERNRAMQPWRVHQRIRAKCRRTRNDAVIQDDRRCNYRAGVCGVNVMHLQDEPYVRIQERASQPVASRVRRCMKNLLLTIDLLRVEARGENIMMSS